MNPEVWGVEAANLTVPNLGYGYPPELGGR